MYVYLYISICIDMYMYIYIYVDIDIGIDIDMSSGLNYMLNLMPFTNEGLPLSVVRISAFQEVSQMGYRYRVVPYRL